MSVLKSLSKIGFTFTIFNTVGNTPVSRVSFVMRDTGMLIIAVTYFSGIGLDTSASAAALFLSPFIIFFSSDGLVGSGCHNRFALIPFDVNYPKLGGHLLFLGTTPVYKMRINCVNKFLLSQGFPLNFDFCIIRALFPVCYLVRRFPGSPRVIPNIKELFHIVR